MARLRGTHKNHEIEGSDHALHVKTFNGSFPSTYNKQTSNSNSYLIQKGQLNKLKLRPQILNEHAESSNEIQSIVTSTNIVGQIFKASRDNINGISLTMESAGGSVIDDYESYANDAALQAVWVKNGTNEALLEETIVHDGSKAFKGLTDVNGDEWIMTLTSTDFTGYNGAFDFYQDQIYDRVKVRVFIGDGTNTKSFPLVVNTKNSWYHFDFNEAAMTEDGGGTTNVAAITKIGFRIEDKEIGKFFYVDNLISVPPAGEIELKLWNFGTSIPVSATDGLNNATQYTEIGDRGFNGGTVETSCIINLEGGKRLYHIKEFVAGTALEIPANTLLTVDNYYAITIHYVDTIVEIYGPNSTYSYQYYNNGYAFTTPNEISVITALGTYNDLMFLIFSTQDIYIYKYAKEIYNSALEFATIKNATESIYTEGADMEILDILENDKEPEQDTHISYTNNIFFMPKGGKFEIYYNDDYSDDVFEIVLAIGYYFINESING